MEICGSIFRGFKNPCPFSRSSDKMPVAEAKSHLRRRIRFRVSGPGVRQNNRFDAEMAAISLSAPDSIGRYCFSLPIFLILFSRLTFSVLMPYASMKTAQKQYEKIAKYWQKRSTREASSIFPNQSGLSGTVKIIQATKRDLPVGLDGAGSKTKIENDMIRSSNNKEFCFSGIASPEKQDFQKKDQCR